MDLRPYSSADRNACLAVFDSNTPVFFNPTERADFERFLDAPEGAYFVMEHEGEITACGGYSLDTAEKIAILTWGMVRRDLHRHGLGRFLLLFRLREIGKLGGIPTVRVRTSQYAAPFFEEQGFRITDIVADAFAPGIDRIELVKKLIVCA